MQRMDPRCNEYYLTANSSQTTLAVPGPPGWPSDGWNAKELLWRHTKDAWMSPIFLPHEPQWFHCIRLGSRVAKRRSPQAIEKANPFSCPRLSPISWRLTSMSISQSAKTRAAENCQAHRPLDPQAKQSSAQTYSRLANEAWAQNATIRIRIQPAHANANAFPSPATCGSAWKHRSSCSPGGFASSASVQQHPKCPLLPHSAGPFLLAWRRRIQKENASTPQDQKPPLEAPARTPIEKS